MSGGILLTIIWKLLKMVMRYKILCLTTGDYVKLKDTNIFRYCEIFVREAANTDEVLKNQYSGSWQPIDLVFTTKDAAAWFYRRRLSYNPRRTAGGKLITMDAVFELNGINPLSSKVEYDIVEIE